MRFMSLSSEMRRTSSCTVTSDDDELDLVDGNVGSTDKKKSMEELKPAECSVVGGIEEKMSRHSGGFGGANKESKGNISPQRSGNGRRRRTGSRNIKEVTFTDSMEQKKLGDILNDSKIEDRKNCESPRALLERRLLRSSSAKGASFRDSLKYVKEDAGSDKDVLDGNSSAESGGRRLPARRLPSSATARGSFHKSVTKNAAAVDDRPRVRRLPRRSHNHTKGSSFRGILKYVMEDVEPDMNESINLEDGHSVEKSVERRQGRARLRVRRSSIDGGSSFRMNSEKSSSLIHSDSSTLSASYQSGIHKESVNLMDFGVDHHRRPFTESMLSLGVSSTTSPAASNDNMSNLVDSCGFLGWDNDSHSLLSNRSNYGPVSKRRAPKRSELCCSNSSSLISNLVDSTGFLGWDSQLCDSSSQDLTASIIAAAAIADENDKEESDVKDKNEDSSEELCESWRIEDYEDPNDMIDLSKRSGSGNILSRHMKRLSSKVSEGMIISARRNSWNVSAHAHKQAVKTNDIERILLQRYRSSDEPMSNMNKTNENTADRPRRNSAFSTFFSRKKMSSNASVSDPEDEYYSRPAIRINREDDVDIGKLRRELLAGSNEGNTKDRLKMGFF
mmetsp:Transcript_14277/g.25070  ORF Transcript_14277/g.25070 Transcript_14277/m.25070 type:complete len:617 (-) Transcript_14277:158-2008(-)